MGLGGWVWQTTVLLTVVTCGGAIVPLNESFQADAYHHPALPYRIAYASPGNLLGDGWLLDNYDDKKQLKSGGRYATTQLIDTNGDGALNYERKTPTYDLRFESRYDAGIIWIRTFPVSTALKERKLAALLDAYLESISGTDYEVVFVNSKAYRTTAAQRYAARVIEQEPVMLGKVEALEARVELVNLDQNALSDEAGKTLLSVVLAMTPYQYEIASGATTLPVLFVAAYSNRPVDFESGLKDFRGLVKRVEMPTR
jgi:hypothetical protein